MLAPETLSELQAKKATAQVDVSPEALAVALAVWRGQIEDALAPGSVRGATASGSILTTFMIEGKKTRQTPEI
jgi:hypothetical protein